MFKQSVKYTIKHLEVLGSDVFIEREQLKIRDNIFQTVGIIVLIKKLLTRILYNFSLWEVLISFLLSYQYYDNIWQYKAFHTLQQVTSKGAGNIFQGIDKEIYKVIRQVTVNIEDLNLY